MSAITTFEFDGAGAVPAHRHRNPDDTEGGWVAEAERLEARTKEST